MFRLITGDIKTNNRPNVNSILHLFGGWLFEAAFIGNEDLKPNSNNDGKIAGNLENGNEKSLEMPAALSPGKFELGKAEALGALCRIFCGKKTHEEISPLYLARFYLALQKGLTVQKKSPISDTLGMIFVNSGQIFRSNLDGVNIVLPHFISALEVILAEKEAKVALQSVTHAEVRRSAIQILLSILPLPNHFKVCFFVKGCDLSADHVQIASIT